MVTKTYILTVFLLASCGISQRQSPVVRPETKPSAQQGQNPQGNGNLGGGSSVPEAITCTRNNCPEEANLGIRLKGDALPNGLIGETSQEVQWTVLIENDKHRKIKIATNNSKNKVSFATNYPGESKQEFSALKLNWKFTQDTEGEIHFVIRDITRCDALAKEEQRADCNNLTKPSDFDVPLKIPFKVATHLLTQMPRLPQSELESNKPGWKEKLAKTGVCAFKKLAGGEETITGNIIGHIANGTFSSGKDTCAEAMKNEAIAAASEESDAEANTALCQSLNKNGLGFGMKGETCECSIANAPNVNLPKRTFLFSCLGLDSTQQSFNLKCYTLALLDLKNSLGTIGCQCPNNNNLEFAKIQKTGDFVYSCFK